MRSTLPLGRALRRLALTTKMVNKGFYKGTRSGSMGRHTKHGGYIIEWAKVRTYVVPEMLKNFKFTPFITKKMDPLQGDFKGYSEGAFSGQRYLDVWKRENGQN
ncbi:hypothetical protein MMC25_006757 [Agyrium rufum]|nr:hypothetical protein [Agyrium rufum]